ncbi:MAG: response regulator [Verrucomicrobiota bacterium]
MRKKLLLAEDSITMRKVFELALARSDVSLIAVDNGHDAIRLFEEIGPDLVIADVTLPGVDGYGVASAIRESRGGKAAPVLILAGAMTPVDEERFKACGAKGVLVKPFEYRELLEKVEGLTAEAAPVAEVPRSQEAPPADVRWDFADVLEEVEGVIPAGRAEEAGRTAETVSPGQFRAELPLDAPVALDEYDVSIDEIEEPAPEATAAPAAAVPPEPAVEVPVQAAHIEGSLLEDAPPAITELSLPPEEPEEIEEIEDLPEIGTASEEPGAAEPPVPPPSSGATAAGESEALTAALREQFAARADEIFRAVAAEVVEKAMWEMMDRLAAEVSERLRESVEAVAWEVIPATAETLIRDEIARIRTLTGKPSP